MQLVLVVVMSVIFHMEVYELKKLTTFILILALAVPLLTACAKPGAPPASGSGTSGSQAGTDIGEDRGEQINNDKYFYFIYSSDDRSKWIRDYIGNAECTEGYFYRCDKERRETELLLDVRLAEYAQSGSFFYAVTDSGELIKFPNAAKVQSDEMRTLYRRRGSRISSLCLRDGVAYFIEGDEIKMLSNEDAPNDGKSEDVGVSETVFICKGVEAAYFNASAKHPDWLVCRSDERYCVYDVAARECIFTGVKFSEQTRENEAMNELDEFLGNNA